MNNSRKKVKEFDAVKMMRKIGDKINSETKDIFFGKTSTPYPPTAPSAKTLWLMRREIVKSKQNL